MPWCTGIGECRCRSHHFEFTQNIIELLRPALAVELVLCQKHCHAHEELLRQFYGYTAPVLEQISVIQRTKSQIGKLKVTFRLDIVVKVIKVVLVFQAQNNTSLFFPALEMVAQMVVACKAGCFMVNIVKKESCCDKGPVGPVNIDLVNRCLDECCLYLLGSDHITELQLGINFQFALADTFKPLDRCCRIFLDLGYIQCLYSSVTLYYSDHFNSVCVN